MPLWTRLHIASTHLHLESFDAPPVREHKLHPFRSTEHRGRHHRSTGTRMNQRNVHSFDLSASSDFVALLTAHCLNPPRSSCGPVDSGAANLSPRNTWWPLLSRARNRFLRPRGFTPNTSDLRAWKTL